MKAVTFSTALPTVSKLNPSTGLPSGGNSVVITGTNFTDVFAVKFGSATASFTVNSATQITAVAPTGALGSTVDVTVETAAGTSATSSASKYTYGLPTLTALNPASGPTPGRQHRHHHRHEPDRGHGRQVRLQAREQLQRGLEHADHRGRSLGVGHGRRDRHRSGRHHRHQRGQ